MAAYLAKAPS